MNDSLFSKIKSLPPLPESISKIQTVCSNPNASINDLTKVVEQDPMITANILKAANSPLYGFSREIKTLSQAVSLFGMATVRGFALASVVKSTIPIDMSPYEITAEQFADLSQIQNALMVRWYTAVDRAKLDVLSPAAFLIGIGRVVLSNEVISEGKENQFKALVSELNCYKEAEEKLFEVNYEEISAAVFRHWRFEPLMVDAIEASTDVSTADESVKPYAIALRAVQDAVTIRGISKESIEKAVEGLANENVQTDKFEAIANELMG